MGMSDVLGSDFNRLHTSYPSISGIMTSRSIKSGWGSTFARSSALAPLVAILTMYVSFRVLCATSMLAGMSSTTRMICLSELVFTSLPRSHAIPSCCRHQQIQSVGERTLFNHRPPQF